MRATFAVAVAELHDRRPCRVRDLPTVPGRPRPPARPLRHRLTRRPGSAARLLDVVDDSSASALVSWMNQRDAEWRPGIGAAALDPYRGCANAPAPAPAPAHLMLPASPIHYSPLAARIP